MANPSSVQRAYPLQTRFRSRCQLVIRLIDAVTGRPPAVDHDLRCSLDGSGVQGLRKDQGYVVFLDAPGDDCTICISSKLYFESKITVNVAQLDRANPIYNCVLLPMPHYPFPPGIAMVRGKVVDGHEVGVSGITLEASLSNRAELKLMQAVDAASAELQVIGQNIALFPGQQIIISNIQQDVHEVCRILAVYGEKVRTLQLETPLQHAFDRGAEIRPLWHTQSADTGEWVLAVPGNLGAAGSVTLSGRTGALKWNQVIELEGRKSTYICLFPET